MLTTFFAAEKVLRRLRSGLAGAHVDDFARHLGESGYSREIARDYLRAAAHLGSWAKHEGLRLCELDERTLDAFRHHLSSCRCQGRYRGRYRRRYANAVRGARRFLDHLRRAGVAAPVTAMATGERWPILQEFAAWMRQHRGVANSTLRTYEPVLARLLGIVGDDPQRFGAGALRAFVLAESERRGPGGAKQVVSAARTFLRYLVAEGRCPAGLEAAIPTVAHWHLSALPRYLQASEVERIVAACDPSTVVGARDRAIVLLIARLGLRAGDLIALRYADLDWQQGSLRVAGKGRRESLLPLPQEVGDAILTYLGHGGLPGETRHVFTRAHAPRGPFATSGAVSAIVMRAMCRAGVKAPSRAHALRHSAATAMLRSGVSLEAIATVLRHRSYETTAHYAKVDVVLLGQIAQPWPEVAPC